MKRLSQYYAQLSQKSFNTSLVVALILCDVFVLSYLYLKFMDPALFEKSMAMAFEMNGLDPNNFGPEFMPALHALFHRSLVIMLSLAFVYHLISYYFLLKKRAFALYYVKFLMNIGCYLLVLWGFGILFVLSPFGLAFVILGMNLHFMRARFAAEFTI